MPIESTARKRRPAFDRAEGVAIAQALFHERGYDAVSVADLTKALGINPPSLYAAYGSKAELFDRAMKRYVSTEALRLDQILTDDKAPAKALTELLVGATEQYTRHERKRGCMVTEGMRADDEVARSMATKLSKAGNEAIGAYVEAHNPEGAKRITDYVLLTLRGLSSYACLGYSTARLTECAMMAGRSLEQDFAKQTE